jgi:hypothetical protein
MPALPIDVRLAPLQSTTRNLDRMTERIGTPGLRQKPDSTQRRGSDPLIGL